MRWELPREAWERYLADRDGGTLLVTVRTRPPIRGPVQAGYPQYHRLRDVPVGDQAYRVCRLVDGEAGEFLFVEPTHVPDFTAQGVPYWLQGEALRRWVRDEVECPAKEEVDWEQYWSG